ncbi:hypothetical protein ZIOFF_012783 [Zingiber officinale]|uniref:Jacalin-type lectin domain-containing protein n=1 Tax=Zingiber officinale TaxID=94328 RepID=A0A8J5HL35_ZINOF|nr:hypothetical protein ZIOFF_012783 [Zingiber officinale]
MVGPTGIKIGPWGTPGACSFDIAASASQITRVRLHTGTVVDSLEVSYLVDRKNIETRRLGGDGGGSHYTVRKKYVANTLYGL